MAITFLTGVFQTPDGVVHALKTIEFVAVGNAVFTGSSGEVTVPVNGPVTTDAHGALPSGFGLEPGTYDADVPTARGPRRVRVPVPESVVPLDIGALIGGVEIPVGDFGLAQETAARVAGDAAGLAAIVAERNTVATLTNKTLTAALLTGACDFSGLNAAGAESGRIALRAPLAFATRAAFNAWAAANSPADGTAVLVGDVAFVADSTANTATDALAAPPNFRPLEDATQSHFGITSAMREAGTTDITPLLLDGLTWQMTKGLKLTLEPGNYLIEGNGYDGDAGIVIDLPDNFRDIWLDFHPGAWLRCGSAGARLDRTAIKYVFTPSAVTKDFEERPTLQIVRPQLNVRWQYNSTSMPNETWGELTVGASAALEALNLGFEDNFNVSAVRRTLIEYDNIYAGDYCEKDCGSDQPITGKGLGQALIRSGRARGVRDQVYYFRSSSDSTITIENAVAQHCYGTWASKAGALHTTFLNNTAIKCVIGPQTLIANENPGELTLDIGTVTVGCENPFVHTGRNLTIVGGMHSDSGYATAVDWNNGGASGAVGDRITGVPGGIPNARGCRLEGVEHANIQISMYGMNPALTGSGANLQTRGITLGCLKLPDDSYIGCTDITVDADLVGIHTPFAIEGDSGGAPISGYPQGSDLHLHVRTTGAGAAPIVASTLVRSRYELRDDMARTVTRWVSNDAATPADQFARQSPTGSGDILLRHRTYGGTLGDVLYAEDYDEQRATGEGWRRVFTRSTGGAMVEVLQFRPTGLTVNLPVTGNAVTQSNADATAGRLLKVGDFGVGGTVPVIADLDAVPAAGGGYSYGSGVAGTLPSGAATTGMVTIVVRPGGVAFMDLTENSATCRRWTRRYNSGWGSWNGPAT